MPITLWGDSIALIMKNISFVILIDAQTNWLGQPSRIFDPLSDHTTISFLVEQLGSFEIPIIFSVYQGNSAISEKLHSFRGVEVIESSTANESHRLLDVCERFNLNKVIRLSGDNPFLGSELIYQGIELMHSYDFIYTYGFPIGINIEFINKNTIRKCLETGSDKRVREIITTDLSRTVKIGYLQAEGNLNRPETRWTTGSKLDFDHLKRFIHEMELDPAKLPSLNELMDSYNSLMQNHLPMPTMVNIEPTNKCNLKCIMCPRDEMERSLGVMDLDTFKEVIDQCVESGVSQITLNGYGEPFIAKQIFEMIEYTMQTPLNLKINTNGHYLNSKNIEQLLNQPPHHLSISLDGATKETYERVRINGRFDRLMSNLDTLLAERAKRKNHPMKITLQIIRMDETEEEIDEFISQWKSRVDEISIPNIHNWGGLYEESGNLGKMEVKRVPCKELWRTMMVFQDGSTSICCAVFDNNMNMGNIKEQHLSDIWRSDDYNQLRQHHMDGNFHLIDICKDCNMWKSYG